MRRLPLTRCTSHKPSLQCRHESLLRVPTGRVKSAGGCTGEGGFQGKKILTLAPPPLSACVAAARACRRRRCRLCRKTQRSVTKFPESFAPFRPSAPALAPPTALLVPLWMLAAFVCVCERSLLPALLRAIAAF